MTSNVSAEPSTGKPSADEKPMGTFRATDTERRIIAVAAAHAGEKLANFVKKASLERAAEVLEEVKDQRLSA